MCFAGDSVAAYSHLPRRSNIFWADGKECRPCSSFMAGRFCAATTLPEERDQYSTKDANRSSKRSIRRIARSTVAIPN
jgi:hypothetical protein